MSEETRTVVIEPEHFRLRGLRFLLPNGEELAATRRTVTFGAHPDCHVVVDHPSVSRRHAILEANANGFKLRDQGSKNGTFLNGVRIEEAYLPVKGTLTLGQLELPFAQTEGLIEVSLSRRSELFGLSGKSPAMREIFATIDRIAPTQIPVLIEGESGTGKELAAKAVHQKSHSNDAPFVIFDCSAIQAELLESELFGHEAGSFSGAHEQRKGALELAGNGTLFIDEIGDLSMDLQPKLLRALDKGEFKRVGGNELMKSNARIVAATHHDLVRAVEDGNFRQDLYYRLAGLRIEIPPLRDRREDIPLLVQGFLQEMGDRALGVQIPYETMEKLKQHSWPGNVRELKNAIERAVALSSGSRVESRYLEGPEPKEDKGERGDFRFDLPFKDAKNRLMVEFERAYWEAKLKNADGNISQAARDGGIHRKSLEYLIKKLSITVERSG